MKRPVPFFQKYLCISILFLCTALSVEADNYTQPVIKSSFPPQIEVTQEGGEMKLVLIGESFLIVDPSNIWNARSIYLNVRHSEKGGNWQPLFNNLRVKSDGYPNPPRSFGSCYYDSDSKIRVWLPRNIWCNTEGTLEFIVIKTRWGNDGNFHEVVRSNIYGIPVKRGITGMTEIFSLHPEYFVVNKKNPETYLHVKGKFDFGTTVLIDNIDCKIIVSNPFNGIITAVLPPGMLHVQAMHSVHLKDSQNTPCKPKFFWVYGPPKVKRVNPNRLTVGMGKTDVYIRYGGLKPTKVTAKVEFIVRTSPSRNQKVVKNKTPIKPWNKKGGAGASQTQAPPTSWEEVPFNSSKRERLNISLSSKWTVYEGLLKIRLKSDAGNAEVKIPIKKPKPAVKYKPPKLTIKKPIKRQTDLLKTKYKKHIIELARMIVELKPDRLIKVKAGDIYKTFQSETKGSPSQTGKSFLNVLKNQVQKEIWNTENQKNKQITQQQRRHIQKLIQMIKQMVKLRN